MTEIVRSLSGAQRDLWLDSFNNLWTYNLLQPDQALQRGAEVRRREWRRWTGGKGGGLKWHYIGAGAAAGFVAGLVLGLALPDPAYPGLPLELLAGLLGAPVGGYGGHVMSRTGSYHDAMILIVANERRSRIRKHMVTAQTRAWVPKTLVAFRSQDWRYAGGRPYMWLMLPYGVRIHEAIRGTASYLSLPDDFYRAKDAAVYAQRAWNRMVSDNGDDYAALDEPEEEVNRLTEIGPWLGAAVIVGAGILMFLLTLG